MKQPVHCTSSTVRRAHPQGDQWPLGLRASLHLTGVNVGLQLPFWIAQHFYSFQRPLFNFDVVIALLGFSVTAWLGWALLAGAVAVDLVRILSLNYHFLDLMDFIESVRFAGLLNLGSLLSPGLILFVTLVLAYIVCFARYLRHWRGQQVKYQLLLVFLLAGLDSLNGSMQFFNGGLDRFRLPVNVAGSPTWNLVRTYQSRQSGEFDHALTPMPSDVRDAVQRWHAAHPERSVVLVLVESMGMPKSAVVLDWLTQQGQTIGVTDRWVVRQGSEGFRGATTHGELRVLCGLDGPYDLIDEASAAQCLPVQMGAQGFDPVGYHGFQLTMFNRARWWPLVGLKPHDFDYQHAAPSAKNCHNVFHGMCDAEVFRGAIAHAQNDRSFSYVVTLDTHLPLPVAAGDVPAEVRNMCVRQGLAERACELVNQLGVMLRTLGSQLASGSATPYVAIVGDHAPPFLERESRAAFLPDKVPFILYEPKR